MPTFKRKRTASRKRSRTARRTPPKRRIRKATRQRAGFTMFNQIVQKNVKTTLRYADTKTLAIGTGMSSFVYRANSIFDPDHTGVGHQPYFHDQWAVFYTGYRVVGFRWKVTFSPSRSTADISDVQQTHTGAVDTYPYILEKPQRSRHIVFTELANSATGFSFTEAVDLNALREMGTTFNGTQWKPSRLNGTASLKGWLGKSGMTMLYSDKQNYEKVTAVGSNPTNEIFISIGAMSEDGGDTDDLRATIMLEYDVEYSGNVDVDAS